MRVVRVSKSAKTRTETAVEGHGINTDDTVGVAASKLQSLLGSPVYMWCHRRVDAHEAFGVLTAGTAHEAEQYDAALAFEQRGRLRCAEELKRGDFATPLKLLKRLQRSGPITEAVSMRARYIVPGGYYADHGIDPYAGGGPRVDRGFIDRIYSNPYSTNNLLLESFDCDAVYMTTREDLERANPGMDRDWKAGVLDKYVPPRQDQGLYNWTPAGERKLQEQRRGLGLTAEPHVRYVIMAGGMPAMAPKGVADVDRLMTAFVETKLGAQLPMVRIQGAGVDRPVTRVHKSMTDEQAAAVRALPKKEWLQVVLKGGKGQGVLSVFPNNSYRLQVRFGYLESGTAGELDDYFAAANAILKKISVFIRPLSALSLCPSSSVFDHKASMLNTPHITGGQKNGIYQVYEIPTPRRCTLAQIQGAIEGGGFPSLKLVNTKDGEVHAQWMRSNALTVKAVVKNLVDHTKTLTGGMVDKVAAELGIDRRDIVEASNARNDKYAVLTRVKIRPVSDTSISVHVMNGNDPEYGNRVGDVLITLLQDCGKKKAKGASDWRTSTPDWNADMAYEAELDEFYQFFESEDAEVDMDGAISEAEEQAPKAADDQKADILARLKRADPEVFAFQSQPGYQPYSTSCQKTSKRQPLVLSKEDAERARRDSKRSESGSRAMEDAVEFRDNVYVCPEKWCPVSGVARGLHEDCPEADEPEWTMWNSFYPGFQSGVKHPNGLCMPCCFGNKPKPGSKTHSDMMQCMGMESDKKSGHINKATRNLDKGMYGYAPSGLFPVEMKSPGIRRGMGPRESAAFVDACVFLFGMRDRGEFLSRLADGLTPARFIQGNVRAFVDADAEPPTRAQAKAWLAADPLYASMMGLRAPFDDDVVLDRERVLMGAHQRAVRALREGAWDHGEHLSLLRWANSGALGENAPSVLLVTVDETGNAFVEHVQDRAFKGKTVYVVMARLGVHEPVGRLSKVRGVVEFDAEWSTGSAWVQSIRRAVTSVLPLHGEKSVRVVSYAIMAVGVRVVKTQEYLPYPRPVLIDPDHSHRYISDGALDGAQLASDATAERALDDTDNPFFQTDDWKAVGANASENDRIDKHMFLAVEDPEHSDPRQRLLEPIFDRLGAVQRLSSIMLEEIDPGVFVMASGETARARVAEARRRVRRTLPPDVLRGTQDAVLDFVIESLIRPVPSGVVPTLHVHPDERVL